MARGNCFVVALTIALAGAAHAQMPGRGRAEFVRPERIVFPDQAPYSPQAAALGKMLFFDPRLSGAQNMSCATCHNPSFGWETPVARAIGALNVPLARHAPSLENLAEATSFFWDGRAPSLERQALGPITERHEMNSDLDDLVSRFRRIAAYRDWFEVAFPGEGLTSDTLLRALATYERTLQSGWAPFDEWVEGREDAIPEPAKRGFDLFVGKAGCASCHTGWAFTDHRFHDIGLGTNDLGRWAVDHSDARQRYAFKTPGLRNIALRAPYMHDGSLGSLAEVIAHYTSGGVARQSRAPQLGSIRLSASEAADLLAFLDTLTASDSHVAAPALPAQ